MTWKIAQKITFLEILEVNNRNLNLSFLCHFTFEIYCTTFISYSENLLNPYFIGNYNTNYIVRIMVPWLGLIFFSYYLLFLIPAIGSSSLLPPMIWSKKQIIFEIILITGTHKAVVYGEIVTTNYSIEDFRLCKKLWRLLSNSFIELYLRLFLSHYHW